jgi:predicted nucleic acid-binding protein
VIVADASLLAHLLIPGSETSLAEAVFGKDPEWTAPPLWRSELRSVVLKHIRVSRMTFALANTVFETALRLIGDREMSMPAPLILENAIGFKISAYDAEYVALARQLDVPLLSFDRKLRAAAPDVVSSPQAFVA